MGRAVEITATSCHSQHLAALRALRERLKLELVELGDHVLERVTCQLLDDGGGNDVVLPVTAKIRQQRGITRNLRLYVDVPGDRQGSPTFRVLQPSEGGGGRVRFRLDLETALGRGQQRKTKRRKLDDRSPTALGTEAGAGPARAPSCRPPPAARRAIIAAGPAPCTAAPPPAAGAAGAAVVVRVRFLPAGETHDVPPPPCWCAGGDDPPAGIDSGIGVVAATSEGLEVLSSAGQHEAAVLLALRLARRMVSLREVVLAVVPPGDDTLAGGAAAGQGEEEEASDDAERGRRVCRHVGGRWPRHVRRVRVGSAALLRALMASTYPLVPGTVLSLEFGRPPPPAAPQTLRAAVGPPTLWAGGARETWLSCFTRRGAATTAVVTLEVEVHRHTHALALLAELAHLKTSCDDDHHHDQMRLDLRVRGDDLLRKLIWAAGGAPKLPSYVSLVLVQ